MTSFLEVLGINPLPSSFKAWHNSVPHDCRSEAPISLLAVDWGHSQLLRVAKFFGSWPPSSIFNSQ